MTQNRITSSICSICYRWKNMWTWTITEYSDLKIWLICPLSLGHTSTLNMKMNRLGLETNIFLCKNTHRNKKQIFSEYIESMIIRKWTQINLSSTKWKAAQSLRKMIAFAKSSILITSKIMIKKNQKIKQSAFWLQTWNLWCKFNMITKLTS